MQIKDNVRVQMLMEHFGGRHHWEDIKRLMARLVTGAGGRTGASSALGWDEGVMLAYRCAHLMRGHGFGEVVVVNLFTWVYVPLRPVSSTTAL